MGNRARAKVTRRTPRRGTTAVASRSAKPARHGRAVVFRKLPKAGTNGDSKAHNGIHSYGKALRFLARLVDPIVGRLKPGPTYFDVLTAIAFNGYAEQKAQVVVVETGLGGRLDSTNVIKPEVTAITSISKDHMAQLGHTLGKIAEEKAGSFKHGIPALTGTQDPAVEDVRRPPGGEVGGAV